MRKTKEIIHANRAVETNEATDLAEQLPKEACVDLLQNFRDYNSVYKDYLKLRKNSEESYEIVKNTQEEINKWKGKLLTQKQQECLEKGQNA